MKQSLLILVLTSFFLFSATAQYIPVPAGSQLSLNGTWKFNPAPSKGSYETKTFHKEWSNISVPGEWTMQGFDVKKGTRAAFQTQFRIPAAWNGSRIILRFDAVYSDAIVWVNGKKAAVHTGGFNVFETDITSFLNGNNNLLTVGVMNESIADTLSCGSQYAAHPLGGIIRKVTVFPVPELHVSDLFITTDLDDRSVDAKLRIDLALSDDRKIPGGGDLEILLLSPEGKQVAAYSGQVDGKGKRYFTHSVTLETADPLKWTAEDPWLYTVKLKLSSGAGSEIIERKTGFRELTIAGNKLFLNGHSVKLHGVNRHEVHPLKGRALDMDLWRKDAVLFKEANVNYIRTSHYPPAEEFIALCDSIGLYVELENPLVWIGHSANLSLSEETAHNNRIRKELVKTTNETVTFYRNHPSVIIWSMANESAWNDNWKAVHKVADSIDPSRPKSFHDQSYGEYNNSGSNEMQVANIHYPGPKGPAVADTFPRPLLFGEYCHLNTYNRQEIATDPGVRDAWGEGFYRMWEKMYQSAGCLGGAIWSGIDDLFMLPGGRLVGYGEWGPIDGWRRKKPEYYHVMKTYSPVIIKTTKAEINKEGEILLQAENRFDFTDLDRCRFDWSIGDEKGTAAVSATPHSAGILRIKSLKPHAAGTSMHVKIFSPYGRLIDEAEIATGPVSGAKLPYTTAGAGPISMNETSSSVVITGGSLTWTFSRADGMLQSCLSGGDTLLRGGALLMMLPLYSEGGLNEHSYNIPFINSTCSGWKPSLVKTEVTGDTVKLLVSGEYREAAISMAYCFSTDGKVHISYTLTSREKIDPRQIGLVFTVPGTVNNLSWSRKGFRSSYPEWHIGRTEGKAVPFPAEARFTGRPGAEPAAEWRFDANQLGTNDFRSTKNSIFWASLTSPQGLGVAALANGDRAFRSWVNGSSVSFLVAGYTNGGAEIFFSSHLEDERKPLAEGDKFSSSVTLMPLGKK